jgi:hypothetical protein
MAVINDKYKFGFLAEPRTASRSVRDALMSLEGSRETSAYHHINVPMCIRNGYLTREQADEYYFFATIRNPHDWLVTQWHISCPDRYHFKDWLIKYMGNLQRQTIFWRFLDNARVFMRYEKLQEALDQVMTNLGAPTVELSWNPGYKTPNKMNWEDAWSKKLYDWAELNYLDIRRYGYQIGFNLETFGALVVPVTE